MSSRTAPVIIEAAINGVTTKEQNPHTPRLPDEIAADAVACLAAGAAIVHNHMDRSGVPGEEAAERYLEGWRPVFQERPDALVYPTVNAGPDVFSSYAHMAPLAATGLLRIGIIDPGSVNLGSFAYVNSRADIDHQVSVCAEHRLGPSMAIFEPGFLRMALGLKRLGTLPPGAMIKLYFGGEAGYLGGEFGLPPGEIGLDAYLSMLQGSGLPWSVAAIGGDVFDSGLARLAVERGGHVHLGLEDYAGPATPTNRELVDRAVELAAEVGRPVATCDEAAQILGLPRAVPLSAGTEEAARQ